MENIIIIMEIFLSQQPEIHPHGVIGPKKAQNIEKKCQMRAGTCSSKQFSLRYHETESFNNLISVII